MKRYLNFVFIGLCVLCLNGCASSHAAPKHFYFVQMTDIHFGDKDHAQRARLCIDEINALPMSVKCVVVTGDLVSDNITDPNVVSEALSVTRNLRAATHYLPGNHDIDPGKLPVTVAAYEKAFGPLCSKAEYDGVLFLFVYTEPIRQGFSVPGLDVYDWVEKEIALAGSKPIIIFHHSPSVDDFYKGRFHDSWNPDARKRWHQIIESHRNIKAVITGHFHRDEFHWIGDVPLYSCPAVASYFGMVPAYRIYEYSDGKIGYRTEYPRVKAKAAAN
jgi:hypothetical protein